MPENPIREQARFLRALKRSPSGAIRQGGSYAVEQGDRRIVLNAQKVHALADIGALRLQAGSCHAGEGTTDWVRKLSSDASKPEVAKKASLIAGPDGTLRNASESPFLKLCHTGPQFLEPHQIEAGERVCLWGTRAVLRQRVTMSYDPSAVGGRGQPGAKTDVSDMALQARASLARLYRDLPRDCADVVTDVCVFEKGLQTIESERNWPRRSAKLVLRIGLDSLAQQLGLSSTATGAPSARFIAWLQDDARPTRFE